MTARYLIEVTLNSDADCYSIINGEKLILDYEVYEQFSGNKTEILSKINRLISKIKSISYEDSDRHYSECKNTGKKTYTKVGVARTMKNLNVNTLAVLEEVKKIIKHSLFDKKPFIEEWSAGGNQYFSVKLSII